MTRKEHDAIAPAKAEAKKAIEIGATGVPSFIGEKHSFVTHATWVDKTIPGSKNTHYTLQQDGCGAYFGGIERVHYPEDGEKAWVWYTAINMVSGHSSQKRGYVDTPEEGARLILKAYEDTDSVLLNLEEVYVTTREAELLNVVDEFPAKTSEK